MANSKQIKRIFIKTVKVLGWITFSILAFLIIAILLIRLPAIQNVITQKAVSYLKTKIGTEVRLKRAFISFPKKIVLEGLYVEDQSKDTLLYADELLVDTDLWALTEHRIELNKIELSGFTGKVTRTAADSAFNFNYIIEAFAADTLQAPQETDTTSKPWEFKVESITLTNTSILYDDKFTGNFADVKIGELSLDMKEFDPTKAIYKAGKIEITNVIAVVSQSKMPATATVPTDSIGLPDLSVEEIELKNVKLSYTQGALQQYMNADLSHFIIDVNEINLPQNKIDIENIELEHSFISYNFFEPGQQKNIEKNTPDESEFSGLNIPWDIHVKEIMLSDNSLQYYNTATPVQKGSIDLNHLWIFGLQCEADDVTIKGNTIKADLQNLSFQEKSSFALQSLTLALVLDKNTLTLDKFLLESGNSKIQLTGKASFKNIREYQDAKIDFELQQSTIAVKDILFFAPTLFDSLPLTVPLQTKILLTGSVNGTVKDLTIGKLNLKTLTNTSVSVKGQIKGLPDVDRAQLNITLKNFNTTSADIYTILADSLIPASVQLPDSINLSGNLKGTINSPAINAVLTTSSGNAELNGKFTFGATPTYSLSLKTVDLHLGKILKQPQTLGMLDMQASAKGSGLTLEQMNTVVQLQVDKFHYSGYDYKDFKINGTLNKYLFSGEASLHDENLDFTLKGDLDYNQEVPLYKLNFNLVNANFQKLNLAERPLKARGTLEVNLATADFKAINGNMSIYKVGIYNGESLYLVDSLMFVSIDQEGESGMTIESDIISGEFKGTFNLFSIGGVVKQHINRYFSLHDKTITEFKTPQNFKFNLTIKNTDLITDIIIPELEPFVPGKITGEFDSESHILNLDFNISKVKYSTTAVDSISLIIESDETELNYRLRFKNLHIDTLTVDALQLAGKIANDSIYTSFQILNSKDDNKYLLGGVFRSQDENFRFKFLRDRVMLNYSEWTVPEDNYLEFSEKGMVAHNFSISKDQEKIALVTTVKDSTISLEFQQLQLSNLTRVVRGVMPANGTLNGNLKFTTASQGKFNSKLQISELEVLEQPFGDLTLELAHAGDRYAIDLKISNQGSNLNANGFYVSNPAKSEISLAVDLAPLNLELIQPLSFGQLKNVEGTATGTLKLSGNFETPVIRGDILFKDASFKSTYLNSTFLLENETISFEESGIVFNNFTISDTKKNDAIVDGNILTKAYKEFRFNLKVTSRNFQVMNTTVEDNKLYYGKLKLNMQARITGNSNRPRVNMTASLSKDTDLTYVVPQAQKSVMEQKGIVQFVDKDAYLDPFLKDLNLGDTVALAFTGIDISANLELTDEERLNIIIDPVTGDKLSIKGNANLTFDMDASGNMSLSGRYEISEGTYNFSFYKLVKREFDIVKGGSLTWSGDPLNAQIDIRASHLVETSPMDLIANQSTVQPDASYRQRLPFYVYLDINGQLLAPMISFQLDMPIDKRSAFGGAIYAKIQDINTRESDVNKQVFALLILRRFISDNPLENQAGSDLANSTRTSVSRILSDQLNRLSENVKGVQLSVDIKSYEDYSAGEAQGNTEVQLGVSKSLFNDRLVVKLSGNVDVEGENTSQEDVTDYIGDLALEYKLTSDGRFRLTGFRTSNYDMIDGEVTETGAGLIYIKDYNTLRELFKANVKEK